MRYTREKERIYRDGYLLYHLACGTLERIEKEGDWLVNFLNKFDKRKPEPRDTLIIIGSRFRKENGRRVFRGTSSTE